MTNHRAFDPSASAPFSRCVRLQSIVSLFAFIVVTFSAQAEQAKRLHIAAASNFQITLSTLIADFQPDTPIAITTSYASSGKLATQIRYGAPFDLFLSADSERPEALVAAGFADADSRFTYALGQLALWSPRLDTLANIAAARVLLNEPAHRVAMANPALAPYGLAAQRTMQALGASAQRITAESIGQAFHFTKSGNVDAGFVALAQIKLWHQQHRAGSFWVVPTNLHTPIEQQAVITSHAANREAAVIFASYLQSPAAHAIMREHGYLVAATPPH